MKWPQLECHCGPLMQSAAGQGQLMTARPMDRALIRASGLEKMVPLGPRSAVGYQARARTLRHRRRGLGREGAVLQG